MAGKEKTSGCCEPSGGSFKVESLISVDDRGQMVFPKDLRKKAGIKAGDKLAVVSWEKDGEVCCFSLIKVEKLTEMVKGLLGPLMENIYQTEIKEVQP